MKGCMVTFCRHRGKIPGIKYYRITRPRRHRWLKAIGRNPNENISIDNFVCSVHFATEHIKADGSLTADAVPTIYLKAREINRSFNMKPNGMAREKMVKEMIKCRTCLGPLNPSSCTDITKEFVLGKTVKDILLIFIHRMITSPTVGDLICNACTIQVRNFAKYMQNFINVEKTIIEDTIKKQRPSTKDQVNTNIKNPPVNVIYVIPTVNENGIPNLVQPLQPVQLQTVPINCLLASTDNSSTNFDKVPPLIQIATQRTSQSQRLLLPKIEGPSNAFTNEKHALKKSSTSVDESKGKQHDVTDTGLGNRICRTCGDVFTSSNLAIVKCSKCFSVHDDIEVISSDSASNKNCDDNDSNDEDVIIETDPIILIKEGDDEPVKEAESIKEDEPTKDEPVLKVLLKNIRKEFRDTVISVTQNPDQIDTLANDFLTRVRVIEYGPSFSTKKKRILFLGGAMVECMECKVLLKHPRNLKAHFLAAHSNVSASDTDSDLDGDEAENAMKKKTFDCPFCDTKLTTAMLLVEHLHERHTLNNPFKCAKCGREFKRRESYLEHMERFQDSPDCSLKKCRFCPKLMDKSEYSQHLLEHRNIVCDKCGRNFLSINHFRIHYATHGGQQAAQEELKGKIDEAHLCPICGKLLTNPRNMNMHLATHGDRKRDYICHMCPKTFLNRQSLKHHLRVGHEKGKIECPICHIKVKTSSSLTSHHNLKHAKSYTHACKICGEGFTRGDYYRRHLIKHMRQGPLITRNIKKKYNYTGKIESKPVKCKYCLKIFKHIYLLRTHVLSHVKSMRFKCKFCNMTFANMGTRFRHQKRHADPNFDLSCTVCWRRMNSQEELAVHMAKHEEAKKYKCTECGDYLASKYLMRHHMSEKHIPQEQVEKEKQTLLSDALEEFLL